MCHPQVNQSVQIRYLGKVEFTFKGNSLKSLCMIQESTRDVAEHMITSFNVTIFGTEKNDKKRKSEGDNYIRSC